MVSHASFLRKKEKSVPIKVMRDKMMIILVSLTDYSRVQSFTTLLIVKSSSIKTTVLLHLAGAWMEHFLEDIS